MTDGHCFISYSTADALDFATKLADELEGGYPYINAWFDKRDLRPGLEWDIQIDDALKNCKIVLFVMTVDSTNEKSVCKQEWSRALSYKKTVIPLLLHRNIQTPFRLGDRQRIDFTGEFEAGMGQLRRHIAWMNSPAGELQAVKDRLLDAERDLQRSLPENLERIKAEIEELKAEIKRQEEIVKNPEKAEEQTKKNIEAGLEREREPIKPVAGKATTKFINPPPGIAPIYFQDRLIETKQIVDFLNNDAQRLITIVGRGGVGKTAMTCRLLKSLEAGELPDGLGAMKVDGIVYLSESGSHRVNFANIFSGLIKLLPAETANSLDTLYKNPQVSSSAKMSALLDQFPAGKVVLLLDNVEPLINVETFNIGDAELDESLCAFLHGAHSGVKIILTTRIAPRGLNLCEPGRQRVLSLDEGLESPYAENILREMDADGKLGLKTAPAELLAHAREHTRGYPRALEALFAILSSDRYTTLDEILTTAENYLPDSVVQSLVGEAFSRLDGNAQKVMQALAIYNRPVAPAAVDYLLIQHLPSIDSAPVLNRLVTMHFVRRESGRYYLHPVDREFALSRIPAEESEIGWNQKSLTTNAANYFAQARKPRAEWKKLDDIIAQLAEFDLRCAAGDFDSAIRILTEYNLDFDYLLAWGHYGITIDLHSRVKDKIVNKELQMRNLNGLGLAYRNIGQTPKAIAFFEEGLSKAQKAENRGWEDVFLGNIGNGYIALGDAPNAIRYLEQALFITREIGDKQNNGTILGFIGDIHAALGNANEAIEFYKQAKEISHDEKNRSGESTWLASLGNIYTVLNQIDKANDLYERARQIAREDGIRRSEANVLSYIADQKITLGDFNSATQLAEQSINISKEINKPASFSFGKLAQAYLCNLELTKAREAIEDAQEFDEPRNNHNASALHGIIALRQGDDVTARGAFVRAIGQADEILAKTPEYYSALDAKGLALCGLILCAGGRGDPSMPIKMNDGKTVTPDMVTVSAGRVAPTIDDAIETFRKARKIAPHAGVVKSVLRLFDELTKCDPEGVLAQVRVAAGGGV